MPKKQEDTLDPKKKVLFGVIMLGIVLAVSFIFFEIVLRLTVENNQCDLYEFDDELMYTIKPNYGPVLAGNYESQYTMASNEYGFRDVPIDVPQDKVRVMCLGDSFTYGMGVEAEETFCKRLEDEKSYIRSYNLGGGGGYSTLQQIKFYERYNDVIQPDIVLLTFYQNDVDDDIRLETRDFKGDCIQGKTEGSHAIAFMKGYFARNIMPRVWVKDQMYRTRGMLINLGLMEEGQLAHTIFYANYTEVTQNQFELNLAQVAEINSIMEDRGQELIFVVIPDRFQTFPETWERYLDLNNYDPTNYDIEKPLRIIKEFCQVEDINCIHLQDEFLPTDTIYFRDDFHFNQDGHFRSGEIIADYIHNLVVDKTTN